MKFYSPFNLPKEWNIASQILCEDPSLTVQADRDQADINEIVRRFGVTGELPYGVQVPDYDDYSDAPTDFHAAMNYIIDAQDAFMEYPADFRSRFDNDAGKFLAFTRDPANQDELISLGLAVDTRPPVSSTANAGEDAGGEQA